MSNHLVTYNEHMDNVFKALADASRRELLDFLYTRNGQTLGDLCKHLDNVAASGDEAPEHPREC
jgi:hypothetical protein